MQVNLLQKASFAPPSASFETPQFSSYSLLPFPAISCCVLQLFYLVSCKEHPSMIKYVCICIAHSPHITNKTSHSLISFFPFLVSNLLILLLHLSFNPPKGTNTTQTHRWNVVKLINDCTYFPPDVCHIYPASCRTWRLSTRTSTRRRGPQQLRSRHQTCRRREFLPRHHCHP